MLLCSIRSVPVWIGSSRLHWTSTGTDPNGYTLESDPKLVRIVDPYRYGSSRSSVDGRPICTHTGTDPFGSVPVYTRTDPKKVRIHFGSVPIFVSVYNGSDPNQYTVYTGNWTRTVPLKYMV